MYRYSNNYSDFNGDHPNFKLIRDWFVWDCDYYKGLRLMRKSGVNRDFIKKIEECENEKAVEFMRKILNTVDAFTGKTTFDLSTIEFEEKKEDKPLEQNEKSESLTPIKDLATIEELGIKVSSPSPTLIEPVKIVAPSPQKEKIVYHTLETSEEKEIIEQIPPPEEIKKKVDSEKSENDVTIPDDAPKEVKEWKEKAIKLHKKQSYLHAQLSIVGTDEERYEIAAEIMEEVIPSLDKIYDQIREWKKTGIIPISPKDDEFKKGVQMMQKRESLRTRIQKLKNFFKKDTGFIPSKKIQKYKKELREKELEFERINATISSL